MTSCLQPYAKTAHIRPLFLSGLAGSAADSMDYRCADVVGRNACPLGISTGCRIPGNYIRVLQHITTENGPNTDWTPSRKQRDGTWSILDLPAEIRDAIYDFVVPTGTHLDLGELHLDLTFKTAHHHPRPKISARNGDLLALLRTSKQLHREATARLYGANTFWVSVASRNGPCHRECFTQHFGFEDLVPLPSAYARLVHGITIADSFCDCHSAKTPLRIANPAVNSTTLTVRPGPSAEQIDNFMQSNQFILDCSVPCRCLRLVSLDPSEGTYTLRRPPGPARHKCHAQTWKAVEDTNGRILERMREGYVRGERKRGPPPILAAVLIPVVVCAAAVTCCFCVCCWDDDSPAGRRGRMKKRRWWERKDGGGR